MESLEHIWKEMFCEDPSEPNPLDEFMTFPVLLAELDIPIHRDGQGYPTPDPLGLPAATEQTPQHPSQGYQGW